MNSLLHTLVLLELSLTDEQSCTHPSSYHWTFSPHSVSGLPIYTVIWESFICWKYRDTFCGVLTFMAAVPVYCRLMQSPLLAHIILKVLRVAPLRCSSNGMIPSFCNCIEQQHIPYTYIYVHIHTHHMLTSYCIVGRDNNNIHVDGWGIHDDAIVAWNMHRVSMSTLTAVWMNSLQKAVCTTLVLSRQSMQFTRNTPSWRQRGPDVILVSTLGGRWQ